ncbi:MAG: hypothetical protein ACI8RD_003003 [Bacillariaceae sp.]|jgi:hypothetical protein
MRDLAAVPVPDDDDTFIVKYLVHGGDTQYKYALQTNELLYDF